MYTYKRTRSILYRTENRMTISETKIMNNLNDPLSVSKNTPPLSFFEKINDGIENKLRKYRN